MKPRSTAHYMQLKRLQQIKKYVREWEMLTELYAQQFGYLNLLKELQSLG